MGWATQPPTAVGRFAGDLDLPVRTALEQEADAAVESGSLSLSLLPDSARETVKLAGARAELGVHDQPEGPWGSLIVRLRSLCGELTCAPEAAINLEVSRDGQGACLSHVGLLPVCLNLQDLSIRVVLSCDFIPEEEWYLEPGGPADAVTARVGWRYDLPFDHGLEMRPGQVLATYVTFELFDGEWPIPVSLKASLAV